MDSSVMWLIFLLAIALVVFSMTRSRRQQLAQGDAVADAAAEARRWVERLGGQVYALSAGDNAAAKQALSDASERFTAAGAQVDQAKTLQQYRLAQQTAYEGLYYVRAARTALGLDPGPEIPPMPGQQQAGAVTEDRRIAVDGHAYEASPEPSDATRHYYPGGMVAGKPVPRGWYSEPWWRPALVAGAWGVGTYLIASSLFAGMAGTSASAAYDAGYDQGTADAGSGDGYGGESGGWESGGEAGGWDSGGWSGGDFGGGDFGGGDFGGF